MKSHLIHSGVVRTYYVAPSGKEITIAYWPQGTLVGGPNVLWENLKLSGKTVDLKSPGKDWTNFGGDKLWPAPQERSGWPPDPARPP